MCLAFFWQSLLIFLYIVAYYQLVAQEKSYTSSARSTKNVAYNLEGLNKKDAGGLMRLTPE